MAGSQVESDLTPPVEEKLDFNSDALRAKAEAYKNEGNDEYRKKEYSNAIQIYTEGIEVNCKDDELNAQLYTNRATAHFCLANYQASLADARSAVELQPTYIKAILKGASACVELRLYEEAITWCDKGLTIEEENKPLLDLKSSSVDELNLRAMAEVYKNEGNSAYGGKDLVGAIDLYTQAINVKCKDDELNAKLYSNRATAYFHQANYQSSLADARSAVELQPTYIKAISKGTSACVELGLYEEAVTWCDKGLAIEEDNKLLLDLKNRSVDELNSRAMAEVYKNEGNSAYGKKDLVSAIDFYTQGINMKCKDDELNAKLYSNRATAYFHQGSYQETIADARAAVDLQPTYVKAIERGASACIKLKRYEEAIAWCDKGLAIEKQNKALLDLRKKSVDERTEADMTGSFPGGARGFPVGSGGFPGGAEGFPGALGAGGFPEAVTGGGETPILNDLFSDKELLAAFQDPTVMAAFQDISQNPENISKYPNNRKLKTIIDKLDKKFGPPGSGPPPSSGGGFPGGMPFGNMFGGP